MYIMVPMSINLPLYLSTLTELEYRPLVLTLKYPSLINHRQVKWTHLAWQQRSALGEGEESDRVKWRI